MATIEQLKEQAEFLLQQHLQESAECSKEFVALLTFIAEKINQESDEETAGIFATVYDILKKQDQELAKNMNEDIDFLKNQIKALSEVITISDPVRKEELSRLLLEDAGEIQATADFKKEVLREAEENRKGLRDMINDIRQTIEEGDAAELEMLFEAMAVEGEDAESEDECCSSGCTQDETDLENSCCSSDEEVGDEVEDEEEDEHINIFEHLDKESTSKGSVSAQKTECCGGKNDCGSACVCNENCKCR